MALRETAPLQVQDVKALPAMPTDDHTPAFQADDFIFEPHAVQLFQVRDIVCLQTGRRQHNYTDVTLSNGRKLTVRKSLIQIIPRLPKFFFLVRRGWAINPYHVRDIKAIDRRTINLTLSDLSEVIISRNQLRALARQWGL